MPSGSTNAAKENARLKSSSPKLPRCPVVVTMARPGLQQSSGHEVADVDEPIDGVLEDTELAHALFDPAVADPIAGVEV